MHVIISRVSFVLGLSGLTAWEIRSLCLPSVGSACLPGRVRSCLALPACPQLSPARTILVMPVVITLGGLQAVVSASRQYSYLRLMSAAPAVSTHGSSQAFSRAKVWTRLSIGLGSVTVPCACCTVVSESGRAGSSSFRVDRLVMSDCCSLCRVSGAFLPQHSVLHLLSIHAHSSNQGVCCAAPH